MPNVPHLRLDPNSSVPAVRQIADNLRILLVEGQLKPGDELPSVRRVAMELGVHFNTVAEAYRQLVAEGRLTRNMAVAPSSSIAPRPLNWKAANWPTSASACAV